MEDLPPLGAPASALDADTNTPAKKAAEATFIMCFTPRDQTEPSNLK
jgi:hypothetical protein